MDLALSFLLFIICMAVSLVLDISMLLPVAVGFVLFVLAAVRKGFRLGEVLRFAALSLRESFVVVGILLLIGCLTGMWRCSGTVAYFVDLGVAVMPKRLFLLAAFLLAAIMSFALGTSFGVTATAGVILMSIARAGGVSTVLAAGAILSGVYVGDRGSPAASSGNLVAMLTRTDMRNNVRKMLRCSVVPLLGCCAAYGILSFFAPMERVDTALLDALGREFRLHWLCLVPAVIMLALPFFGVSIKLSMGISLVSAVAVAIGVQGSGIFDCLRAMLMGYRAEDPGLSAMLSGGGVRSMLEVCAILIVSCSYGRIFEKTGLLSGVHTRVAALRGRIGRFPAMLVLSAVLSAVFCNQTLGIIMLHNLSAGLYGEDERERKMLDIENSVVVVAGLVPWCIACSVLLSMLGADVRSVPVAFYLWFLPIWWALRTKEK